MFTKFITHIFPCQLTLLTAALCTTSPVFAQSHEGAYSYYNRGQAQPAYQMASLEEKHHNGAFRNYFTTSGRIEAVSNVAQRGPFVRPSKIIRGSGFYVAPDAILTNAHIAKGCTSVTINNDTHASAYVAALDTKRDIALIRTKNMAKHWAALDTQPTLREGSGISVAGYPTERSVVPQYSNFNAEITRDETDAKGNGRILFSKGVLKGNSGGPVISDKDGSVVGMVTGRVRLLFASAAGALFEETQTSGIAVSGKAIGNFLKKSPRVTGKAAGCAGTQGYCGPVTDPSLYTVKITCRK